MARFFLLVSFLCCVLRLSADGINSEKTYDLNDTSKVYDIDEVVVVSSPKEVFRLRQQALSSNSLGAKDLSSLGVRDLRELSDYVPNFEMPSYGSRLTSSMYVRGNRKPGQQPRGGHLFGRNAHHEQGRFQFPHLSAR